MQAPTLWPEVSVVLPARDEAASITALLRDIDRALAGMAHEIIVVDDGSRDGTAELVLAASAELPQLRLIRHARGQGQSAALHNGVRAARGRIVATLDADGQNPPAALPRLIAPLLAEGSNLGLVQGCCQNTAKAARPPLKGDCHCTLRAFPRATYTRLTYFHHLHRFLALEVRRRGQAVLLVEVARSHRGGGRSKYSGLHHALIGGIHLFGATWLLPRSPVAPGQEVTPPPQA
nr:glycosyltransferase family 2 protein [Rhodobacter sp. SW2]